MLAMTTTNMKITAECTLRFCEFLENAPTREIEMLSSILEAREDGDLVTALVEYATEHSLDCGFSVALTNISQAAA
jgi:hypothetical protein